MATFGWAYVDCANFGTIAEGPTGSVQFLTGSRALSGSINFMYHTASVHGYAAGTLVLTGNLVVTGTISASHMHIVDVATIDSTGSTFFGNTVDDIHMRTGSLAVWGRNVVGGSETWHPVLSASSYSRQVFVKGFGGNYTNVTSSHHTASTADYILGVTTGGNIKITVPSPALYSAGAMLVVKDEHLTRAASGNDITLTRSVTDTYTFDGNPLYILTGTMPAINLYSNGTNWFVF